MAGGNPPAALDLRAQIEEDYLTCQICQGPYCRPKALACLHSFCAHCLQEYVCSKRVAPGGRFECPVCRKPMALPRPGVSGLPDNHVLVSLADTMRRVEATAGLRDEAPGPPRGSPPRHGEPRGTQDALKNPGVGSGAQVEARGQMNTQGQEIPFIQRADVGVLMRLKRLAVCLWKPTYLHTHTPSHTHTHTHTLHAYIPPTQVLVGRTVKTTSPASSTLLSPPPIPIMHQQDPDRNRKWVVLQAPNRK